MIEGRTSHYFSSSATVFSITFPIVPSKMYAASGSRPTFPHTRAYVDTAFNTNDSEDGIAFGLRGYYNELEDGKEL